MVNVRAEFSLAVSFSRGGRDARGVDDGRSSPKVICGWVTAADIVNLFRRHEHTGGHFFAPQPIGSPPARKRGLGSARSGESGRHVSEAANGTSRWGLLRFRKAEFCAALARAELAPKGF